MIKDTFKNLTGMKTERGILTELKHLKIQCGIF